MKKTTLQEPKKESKEVKGIIKSCALSGCTLTLYYKRETYKCTYRNGYISQGNSDRFIISLNCADGSTTFENTYDDLIKASKDFKTLFESLQI